MTGDFFRARFDQMIDPRQPLAVLAPRMPWAEIEASLVPLLAHKDRMGQRLKTVSLYLAQETAERLQSRVQFEHDKLGRMTEDNVQ